MMQLKTKVVIKNNDGGRMLSLPSSGYFDFLEDVPQSKQKAKIKKQQSENKKK